MNDLFDEYEDVFNEDDDVEFFNEEEENVEMSNNTQKGYVTIRVKVKESIRDLFKTYHKIICFINEAYLSTCYVLNNLKYIDFANQKININGIANSIMAPYRDKIVAFLNDEEMKFIDLDSDFAQEGLVNCYEYYMDGQMDFKDNIPYLNIKTDDINKCKKFIECMIGSLGDVVAITFKNKDGLNDIKFESFNNSITFNIGDDIYKIVPRDIYKKFNVKADIHLSYMNDLLYNKLKYVFGYCFSNDQDENNSKMLLEEFLNLASFEPDILTDFLVKYEVLGELIVSMSNPEYLGLLNFVSDDVGQTIKEFTECNKKSQEAVKYFDYYNIDKVNNIKYSDGVMYLDFDTKSIDYDRLKEFTDLISKINVTDVTKISINEI